MTADPNTPDIMPRDEVQKLLEKWQFRCDVAAVADRAGEAANLARSLLAAHDEIDRLRADALAAQAVFAERAVEAGADIAERTRPDGFPEEASNAYHSGAMDVVDAIRALASPSGVEALAALRAERDGLLTTWAESRERHLKAEAERDDLRARLAEAEKFIIFCTNAVSLHEVQKKAVDLLGAKS